MLKHHFGASASPLGRLSFGGVMDLKLLEDFWRKSNQIDSNLAFLEALQGLKCILGIDQEDQRVVCGNRCG